MAPKYLFDYVFNKKDICIVMRATTARLTTRRSEMVDMPDPPLRDRLPLNMSLFLSFTNAIRVQELFDRSD
jgi:hypothetical protein